MILEILTMSILLVILLTEFLFVFNYKLIARYCIGLAIGLFIYLVLEKIIIATFRDFIYYPIVLQHISTNSLEFDSQILVFS